TTSISRHRPPGRITARRSAAASRGARAGVSFSVRITTHYWSGALLCRYGEEEETGDRPRNGPAPRRRQRAGGRRSGTAAELPPVATGYLLGRRAASDEGTGRRGR